MLDRTWTARAFSRTVAKTGSKIAVRIAIMAITTRNSMRVKPDLRRGSRLTESDASRDLLKAGFSRNSRCRWSSGRDIAPARNVDESMTWPGRFRKAPCTLSAFGTWYVVQVT